VDYHDPNLSASIPELAPGGVDAVFDRLGGASFRRSFDLLARGGTLLGYGMAAQITDTGSVLVPFLRVYAKLAIWSALPNGRRAMFFNLWGGSRRRGDVAESPARTRGTTSPGTTSPVPPPGGRRPRRARQPVRPGPASATRQSRALPGGRHPPWPAAAALAASPRSRAP